MLVIRNWESFTNLQHARKRLMGKELTEKSKSMSKSISIGKKEEVPPLLQRFLDAFSHLYKRVCPSVGLSVHPSVGQSVRPSITHELKPCKRAVFDQNYYQYERERILWRVYDLVPIIVECTANFCFTR